MHLYENVEGFENPTEDFQAYEEKYLHGLTLLASSKSDLQPSGIPRNTFLGHASACCILFNGKPVAENPHQTLWWKLQGMTCL